ncbi:MAG: efflux RND transporter periplasmic adaptor subunit [Armatimonadetes bacterium]|nr:efflux RND transporter periplasmic adaptor subunit [Armatimonadota bacterium]
MKRLLVYFLLLSALAGCQGGPEPQKETASTASVNEEAVKTVELNAEAQRTAGIETEAAALRMMRDSLEVPGVVTSTGTGRAVVTPPVPGRVVSLQAQLGDSVRAGQTLGIIESSDLAQGWAAIAEAQRLRDAAAADLAQAKSEADLSAAKLDAARGSLKRQTELARAGAFSQAPLQSARTELNESQSELVSAQQDLSFKSEQRNRAERLFKEGLVSKADLEASRLAEQQSRIAVDKVKARVDIAKAAFEREQAIFDRGLLNAKEVQVAEAEVRSSSLDKQRAEIRIQSARAALDNASNAVVNAKATYRSLSGGATGSVGRVALVSPITGVLTRLDVTKGQAVERTQALMEIENLGSVWVSCNVPEIDIAKVQIGQTCSVTIGSQPGREFAGVVQVIGGNLDPKTRTLPVQCLVTVAKGLLKPEMFASVRLGVGRQSEVVAVSKAAISTEEGKSYVFVNAGQKFEKREVETGRAERGFVEIRTGLKAVERVVTQGVFVLVSEFKRDELKGEE